MKYIFYLIILFFSQDHLQSQVASWTNSIGGPGTDYATAVVHDELENVYVAGRIKQKAFFSDACTDCFIQASPLANGDSYLVKYDKDGNHVWSKRTFAENTDQLGPHKILLQDDEIVFIVEFYDRIVLDPDDLKYLIQLPGKSAIIELRYQLDGSFSGHRILLQKNHLVGQFLFGLYDFTYDLNGNVYFSGYTGDTLRINNTVYGSFQEDFGFICKIGQNNVIEWFIDNLNALSISISEEKHLFAGVGFSGTLDLIVNGQLNTFITPDHFLDGILLKFDLDGNIQDAKHFTGTRNQYISKIQCYQDKVTIAGSFQDTLLMVFDGIKMVASNQSNDVFVLRIKQDVLKWHRHLESSSVVQVTDLSYTPAGATILAGIFSDTLKVDHKQSNLVAISNYSPSIFVVKLGYTEQGFIENLMPLISDNINIGPRLSFIDEITYYMTASYEYDMNVHFTGDEQFIISRGGVDGYVGKYFFNYPTSVSIDQNFDMEVSVFPNPTSEKVNISSLQVIGSIRILDLFGRNIQSYTCNSKETSIDLTNTPPGNYIIELINEHKIATRKILIVH